MRVLLVNPPTEHFRGSNNPRIYIPLGLLSIASMLERENYDVIVYDTTVSAKLQTTNGVTHFGDDWDKIKMKIEKYNPDVVGISYPFSSQKEAAGRLAQIVKEINQNIPVIAGGPHASVAPLDCLKSQAVDFVILGEGEYKLLELLRYIKGESKLNEIKNIGYKIDGKIVINHQLDFITDLNDLPMPAYHLVDMEQYFYWQNRGFSSRPLGYGKRTISMITSRGCPYNCIFCSIHLIMGRRWRAHSAHYVVTHIKHLVEKYKVDWIHFEDDNLTFNKNRFEKIVDKMIKEKINVSWDTSNGIRADLIDKSLLLKAMKAGCKSMVIGIESGVQRVLDDVIDKKLDLKKVLKIVQLCKRIKLELYAYYVVGLPGETMEEIKNTLEFIVTLYKKYDVFPEISLATPEIGTRLYKICQEKGYLTKRVSPKELAIGRLAHGKGLIRTEHFSPQEVKQAIKRTNQKLIVAMIKKSLLNFRLAKKYIRTALRNPHLVKRFILRK